MKIEIMYKDGEVSVNSDCDRIDVPVVLSSDEEIATNIIMEILEKNGIDASNLCIQRRTDKYLTIAAFRVYDFLRLKIGKRSRWFSVYLSDEYRHQFQDDIRFAAQKDKAQFHWKSNLISIDQLEKCEDLIVAGYKSAEWSKNKTDSKK